MMARDILSSGAQHVGTSLECEHMGQAQPLFLGTRLVMVVPLCPAARTLPEMGSMGSQDLGNTLGMLGYAMI